MARSLAASCVVLELRSLRSAGVTRLQRYYEPLRHPAARPVPHGRPVGGHAATTSGLPVLRCVPVDTCRRHYPGGTTGCVCRSPSPAAAFPAYQPGRLPHQSFRGLHRTFTRVTACIFAGSLSDPFHRRLRRIRYLHRRFDCYWAEATIPRRDLHPLNHTRLHGARISPITDRRRRFPVRRPPATRSRNQT